MYVIIILGDYMTNDTYNVDRKISDMISHIVGYHHVENNKSDVDYVRKLFDLLKDNNKTIDYITLTIDEFRVLKDEYNSILKNCKISIFMNSVNDITLDEVKDLKKNYTIHYMYIKNLFDGYDGPKMILIDLLYKYKKAIQNITRGIDENYLKGVEDREKIIFGMIIPRIFDNTKYDLEYQKKYKETHKKIYDNPSNSMLGLIDGKCTCKGYSGIVSDVFGSIGIETEIITGVENDSNQGHAWNQIKLDGDWYNIDITWDRENILYSGMCYWLLKDDKTFEYGYTCSNGTDTWEVSHRKYARYRNPGHICTKTLSDEELGKYLDFSDFIKKNWLVSNLKKIDLNNLKSSVAKFLTDSSSEKHNSVR